MFSNSLGQLAVLASLMHDGSDLPLIVSLEIHAGEQQQAIMVEIMMETWRGLLLRSPSEHGGDMPTPDSLKRKILVKVKHGPTPKEDNSKLSIRKIKSSSSGASPSDSDELADDRLAGPQKKEKKSKVIEKLGALGIYTSSYSFKGLAKPEATVPNHVFSLSEKKLMEVHESAGPTLFSHNRNFLMRAFPSGTRISSSNLDPSIYWRKGVQMVALNWQKWDAGMMMNDGMFAGTQGWVLKPQGYRGDGQWKKAIGKESQAEAISHKTLDLSIELYAAQDLPLPLELSKPDHFHPYVKCELHVEQPEERSGAPIEKGGKSKGGQHKRKSKSGRGVGPSFGREKIEFLKIRQVVDTLSFLRLVVRLRFILGLLLVAMDSFVEIQDEAESPRN